MAVDDHALFRKGTMMILEAFEEIDLVLEATNGKEALDKLKTQPVDIVLLDLEMPVMDGWQTARKILLEYPDIKIIMLSMHDSLQVISELIEMGVHSYILKNTEPSEVHRAIQSVLNNDFYYNHLVAKALRNRVKDGTNDLFGFVERNNLTKREVEILELICEELTMREIGDRLFLSEQTIHTHRKNLMKKTKVKNSVGLVKYAIQHQIIHL
jgi:DNA-binding NarL/FixJ family response regulator